MFVEIKIFGEDWKVFTKATLGKVFVRRRFDVGNLGDLKSRGLLPPVVPLQPVLEIRVHEAVAGGEVSDEAAPVHGHVAALGTRERDVLGQQRGDLVLEVEDQVVRLVLGGNRGRANLTFVGGGGHGGHQITADSRQSGITRKYLDIEKYIYASLCIPVG